LIIIISKAQGGKPQRPNYQPTQKEDQSPIDDETRKAIILSQMLFSFLFLFF